MKRFNSSQFLFHVPGAQNIFDPETREFVYQNNWLTPEEFKEMPDQLRPARITVAQCDSPNQRQKLGEMDTRVALEKFAS